MIGQRKVLETERDRLRYFKMRGLATWKDAKRIIDIDRILAGMDFSEKSESTP